MFCRGKEEKKPKLERKESHIKCQKENTQDIPTLEDRVKELEELVHHIMITLEDLECSKDITEEQDYTDDSDHDL